MQDVFVKTYDEAQIVREFFGSITILYGEPKGALAPNMAIAINNKEILHSLAFGSKVELKVNTGMNRNGIDPSELEEYITLITQNGLELFGVFTHNGYGDDLGDDFKIGCENFENIKVAVLHICKKLGIEKPRFHGLNSSGTLRSQTITDDLVRVGIGAYGGHGRPRSANVIGAACRHENACAGSREAARPSLSCYKVHFSYAHKEYEISAFLICKNPTSMGAEGVQGERRA